MATIRAVLTGEGFLEVETPILTPVHGGANARPFRTHAWALDADLYLRIAPELNLKRLIAAGRECVFEVGRNFRNEGVDATHSPEFTSLEAYAAFTDYGTMRTLARRLVVACARAVHGGQALGFTRRGDQVDLSLPWPATTVHDAVACAIGQPITPDTPLEEVRGRASRAGVGWGEAMTSGEIVERMYDKLVEPGTVFPTFYLDFPVECCPLTRPHRRDARLAERWDLVAFGMELGTAYTELADPLDQRARLTAQSLRAAGGDVEAMEVDEDFLTALETGMPPTGGLGLGVDRIVMLLTGFPIRETLTFPLR